MCVVSGIGKSSGSGVLAFLEVRLIFAACVLGASIICIDVLVRYIPGKRDFSIQKSNGFLAASMSLSFGVMVSAGKSSCCV